MPENQSLIIGIMGTVIATCTGAILNFVVQGWREKRKKQDDKIETVGVLTLNFDHLSHRVAKLETLETCCIDDKTCDERRQVLDDKITFLCAKTKREIDGVDADIKEVVGKVRKLEIAGGV